MSILTLTRFARSIWNKAHVANVREILVKKRSSTTLVTDHRQPLHYTGKEFADHQLVCTTAAEYVNKEGFTTNNVENFFGVFKRGMKGTYHFCSEQHLQRYLTEF